MSEHQYVALLRQGYQALVEGDAATVVAMFAEDGVMHVNAAAPLGGDHKGRDAIGGALGRLFEFTGGTVRLEVEEFFADDAHGIVLVRETARRARDGLELDVRETHLLRFADGLVGEFWDLPAEPDRGRHEAFFSEA